MDVFHRKGLSNGRGPWLSFRDLGISRENWKPMSKHHHNGEQFSSKQGKTFYQVKLPDWIRSNWDFLEDLLCLLHVLKDSDNRRTSDRMWHGQKFLPVTQGTQDIFLAPGMSITFTTLTHSKGNTEGEKEICVKLKIFYSFVYHEKAGTGQMTPSW